MYADDSKFAISLLQFRFAVAVESAAQIMDAGADRPARYQYQTSFGLLLAVIGVIKMRPRTMRESITPILYVIIVVTMTLLYVDYENIELLKHPLNALHSFSTAHPEADED